MREDKELARKFWVPKAFRQYSKRYGSGVEQLIACQKQHPVGMLNHWEDRLFARYSKQGYPMIGAIPLAVFTVA